MKDKWDERLSSVIEYPFDYKRYIEKRLREIEDLDERRFAKTVLLEGLGKIAECMERKYQSLEQRIYRETEIEENRYETVVTIIRKSDYDPMNVTLFPVYSGDLEEEIFGGEWALKDEHYVDTIFLKADDKTVQRFQKTGKFSGFYQGKEAVFRVRLACRYREQIQNLYQIFLDNHIPWETIHTGFLDKFFDVFVVGFNDIEEDDSQQERKAEVDYGVFQPMVCFGQIPLWNIEQICFDSVSFMLPCIDGIYYEHEFLIPDLGSEDGYLIKINKDILEIRHEKGKILMKSEKETFEGWQAFHVVQKKTVRSLDYTEPLLTNHKKDSFFGKLSERRNSLLLTKTDLFRRIMALDIEEYIEVAGYEIRQSIEGSEVAESMNWFVRDELFPIETRKVLVLQFREKRQGFYLNDSMVRFVVSQIQLEVNEYLCIGVLIK